MKITITLTDAEVKGIRAYLKADDGDSSAFNIKRFVANIVSGNLHNPRESVNDYISKYEF